MKTQCDPGYGLPHEPSYWAATGYKGSSPSGEVEGDIDCDVAIIGAGYTGLSTAYHLAKLHGVRAHVLEANRIGWGCSGRNGGFAMIGIGKDSYEGWIRKYGVQGARHLFDYARDAVRSVKTMLAENDIDAASPHEGYLYLAHKPNRFNELKKTQNLLKDKFGFDTWLLSREEVRTQYLNSREYHGALFHPEHISLHPMKYVQGLARAARQYGAQVHERTPVQGWERIGALHKLHTPKGSIKTRRVVIATGGYTPDYLHPAVSNKLLNVLSNVIVTEPVSEEKLQQCGWKTHQMLVDTRMLRFYFRLLEDKRVLFGARGGIVDDARSNMKTKAWLLKRLSDFFPALEGVRCDYFWRGHVDIARDKYLHLGDAEGGSVHYALGYAGTGVAASTYSGKQIADRLMGKSALANIPKLSTPLPRFEIPSLRRLAQRAAYGYYTIKDEWF